MIRFSSLKKINLGLIVGRSRDLGVKENIFMRKLSLFTHLAKKMNEKYASNRR